MTETADQTTATHPDARPLEGAVLLSDAAWDAALFAKTLQEDWEIEVPAEALPAQPGDALVFETAGSVIAVKCFDEPLPAEVVQSHAAMNPFWQQAGTMAKLHRAHLAVAALPKTATTMENAATIVRVLAALALQPGALAVDNGSALLGTDGYREGACVMKGGEFPIFNLVTFAVAREDEERCVGCTMGLTMLGFDEIEVLPVKTAPETLQEFLFTVVSWVLKTGQSLKEGTMLGLDPANRRPVKKAPSRLIPGIETMQAEL